MYCRTERFHSQGTWENQLGVRSERSGVGCGEERRCGAKIGDEDGMGWDGMGFFGWLVVGEGAGRAEARGWWAFGGLVDTYVARVGAG